jgi:hypothetical protein
MQDKYFPEVRYMKSFGTVPLFGALLVTAFALMFAGAAVAKVDSGPADPPELTAETAAGLSVLALHCIQTEYPNKPGHVINDGDDVRNPATLHPVFYGCFDWHSAVHGHWMLVRLLKTIPALPNETDIRTALETNITAENVAAEVVYLRQPNRKSFERTYGWAWLLKLAEELHGWDDPDGRRWSENLQPLTDEIVARYMDFLPRQTYPIRRGVHANTAFGIAFALDYARTTGHPALEGILVERALEYYGSDTDYPAAWEPGGDDFFSPALIEADLMRRVLEPDDFRDWFQRFLPGVSRGLPKSLMTPALVADRSDPKIVHLDGLNLSRAWCMAGVAAALPEGSRTRNALESAARLHANDALAHVTSGNYEGEHWLASFAVFTLSMLGGI